MFRCKACGALNKVKPGHAGSPVCGRCKAVLDISGTPQEVDGAAIVRAVNAAGVPLLVDFWAPWCGPCRVVSPIVDHFAKENAGRFIALKLNAEQHPDAADGYGIRSIPTFILFLKGREVGRQSGAMSKDALSAWVAGIALAPPVDARSGAPAD